MITINGFLHREVLSDVIRRWMYDEARPDDADSVVKLVHFNSVFVSRYLNIFARGIFAGLRPGPLSVFPVIRKGELKDALVAAPPYRNERIDRLTADYRLNPGRFYRETPFNGALYFTTDNGERIYVGSSRIKRVRRLAEKSARRIIDLIFDRIKSDADMMANGRAELLGIPRTALLTAPLEMEEEFFRAENRLLEDLRDKKPIAEDGKIYPINDVAGIKVILEPNEEMKLQELIARSEDGEIVEAEKHSGRYNATNLVVRFHPPKRDIIALPLDESSLYIMQARGYSPYEANQSFREFVLSGEEDVLVEIIVSSYQEILESELGRSMHEDRIIEQRLKQQYRGPLARNIGYLLEYLFALPAAGRGCLGELPIKLWNRYLPDYFDEVLKGLFHIPPVNHVS
ncbi:MAG: hypothetical protein ACYC6Q_12740 [Syntrophales bacterium]